jgi:cell division septation protein DedD
LNQTTRQRITGSLVLAITALILLPVIFDGEGSYQPAVQVNIPARPQQPAPTQTDPQRPVITADSDAIRIRPESPVTVIADNMPSGQTAQTLQTAPQVATAQPLQTADSVAAVEPGETDQASNNAQTIEAVVEQRLAATVESVAPAGTDAQSGAVNQPVAAGPVAASTDAAAATSTPPASLDAQGLPEGWSVRLGSFSSADNASALVTRLQAAGHRAYTRRVDSSQGILTAVFVGPLVNRPAAQTLLERLRQDFQLNGMIVRYEIDPL